MRLGEDYGVGSGTVQPYVVEGEMWMMVSLPGSMAAWMELFGLWWAIGVHFGYAPAFCTGLGS